jgi:hypothetical protein
MKKYIYYLVGILILAFAPGCIAHMPYDDSVAYKPDYRVNYYAKPSTPIYTHPVRCRVRPRWNYKYRYYHYNGRRPVMISKVGIRQNIRMRISRHMHVY